MLRRQTDRASREREVVRKQDFKQKQKNKRERGLWGKGEKRGEKKGKKLNRIYFDTDTQYAETEIETERQRQTEKETETEMVRTQIGKILKKRRQIVIKISNSKTRRVKKTGKQVFLVYILNDRNVKKSHRNIMERDRHV